MSEEIEIETQENENETIEVEDGNVVEVKTYQGEDPDTMLSEEEKEEGIC